MALGRRDILSLFIPTFSGSQDEFGKDIVPPLPLFYDRVNENRLPVASSAASILFRLPIELLSSIIQLLSPTCLASFALVNRDCRQLARSRQFASVCLDYGNSSFGLLKVLLEEASERLRNGLTISPSLGACIRRLTVATDPKWVSHRHSIALDEAFTNLEESLREERLTEAKSLFFDWYIPAVQVVIANALPHLELLDWEDKIILPLSFFTRLAQSPVQHLKLFRIRFDEELEPELIDLISRRQWPLRTLYIEPVRQVLKHSGASTTRICQSILRTCAPTLENLAWIEQFSSRETQKTDSQSIAAGDLSHLHFPCLSQFKFKGGLYPHSRILSALLDAKSECHLRVLEADTEQDEATSLWFENCGMIRSLETFVWTSLGLSAGHNLGFLKSNTQLSKLDIPSATPPILLENDYSLFSLDLFPG
jgi:hypothetical protein